VEVPVDLPIGPVAVVHVVRLQIHQPDAGPRMIAPDVHGGAPQAQAIDILRMVWKEAR
jgi:hypothetical protein